MFKYSAYTFGSLFALASSGVVAAYIDVATNDHNHDALPDPIDFEISEQFPTLDPYSSAHFYIEGGDSRAEVITIPETGRVFNRIFHVDDDETGFTASAYMEVGDNNIVFVFNGMSKPWYDSINTPDENPWQAWDDLLTGVEARLGIVNRQMGSLYQFITDVKEIAGQESRYESIGYSLGGIHGLHAKAFWGIPFTGLSPAGLPQHEELYSQQDYERLSLMSSFSFSTREDFITGSVGQTGPTIYLDRESTKAGDENVRIDSIGPHILPTGYNRLFQFIGN